MQTTISTVPMVQLTGGRVDPDVINLIATTEAIKDDADVVEGLDVFGTQFNDEILADAGSFKGRLAGDDTFFSGGTTGSTARYDFDFFDGGGEKVEGDVLVLEGMPTRYDVSYDERFKYFHFCGQIASKMLVARVQSK